jgi:uncharacterized membrane-anchored protein YhcB (DUF1043 family)
VDAATQELIVPALIAAIIGIFIGYLMGRRGAPGSEENRELKRELQTLRDERVRFEQRVNAHFSDTAGKLNALTENYKAVYAQIASGAADLCSSSAAPRFDALAAPAAGNGADGEAIDAGSVQLEPPRDYAPKASPDTPGVLNERFGIDAEGVPPDHSKDDEGDAEDVDTETTAEAAEDSSDAEDSKADAEKR